jgi:hypothetical protein
MKRFCTHIGLVLVVLSGLNGSFVFGSVEEEAHIFCTDTGCAARSAKVGDTSTPTCGGGVVCTYIGPDPNVHCDCVNTPANARICDCFTFL